MRRRWRLNDNCASFWLVSYGVGWVPATLIAQAVFARDGLGARPSTMLPFFITLAVWFAPLVLAGAYLLSAVMLRAVLRYGWGVLPIQRVTEPVLTDLRATMTGMERSE